MPPRLALPWAFPLPGMSLPDPRVSYCVLVAAQMSRQRLPLSLPPSPLHLFFVAVVPAWYVHQSPKEKCLETPCLYTNQCEAGQHLTLLF